MQSQPLNDAGFGVLAPMLRAHTRPGAQPMQSCLALLRLNLSRPRIAQLTAVLNRDIYPLTRRMTKPIPPEALTGMKRNYSEQLPKTMRVRTALISSNKGKSYIAAKQIGVIDLLRSDDLRRLAETATGHRLYPDPGVQIICYEAGDYSGPHNDHHPEEPHLRDGYIDVHIMLPEAGVKSQLLIYETGDGVLNRVEEVGSRAAIAIYKLPFWHYTTPLAVSDPHGRRWLLLASFEIDREERS
jgi:hypothetical protein